MNDQDSDCKGFEDLILDRAVEPRGLKEAIEGMSSLSVSDRLVVLLKVLSKNPDLSLVRLEFAKLLWKLDCVPFALEELRRVNLASGAQSEALKSLISRLGGALDPMPSGDTAKKAVDSKTVASLDFDIEILDPD